MDDRRLAELIELYVDSDLSATEATELRAHLEAQPTALATVLEATQGHVMCRTALRPNDPQLLAERAHQLLAALPSERREQAAKQVMRRIRRRQALNFWGRWAVVAAAALVVLAIKPWNWLTFERAERVVASDGSLPHLISVAGGVHDGKGSPYVVGQTLTDQASIHTNAQGIATVMWPDGTIITVEKASVWTQQSAAQQRVKLSSGEITVQAAHRPATQPLIITTPDATIHVIGTRFSLAVHNQQSLLHVAEGLVRYQLDSDGKSSLVGAGERLTAKFIPPPAFCWPPEQVEAVRTAIRAGRQPWAQTWSVLESQARKWAQEPNVTPALLTIYSWTNERPQHSESRRIYGNAALARRDRPDRGRAS
jgi:hypothetical protein